MSHSEWNSLARDHANAVREQSNRAPRGVFRVASARLFVVFGADDFTRDERSQREVALLRQSLPEGHITELGFSTSDDGFCWCMLVRTNDGDRLHAMLLEAWQTAFDVPTELESNATLPSRSRHWWERWWT